MSSLSGVIFSLHQVSKRREEHTKRKLAKCALRPYKGTALVNDTGEPPGEDADGTESGFNLRHSEGEMRYHWGFGFARTINHCWQLWTEGCDTAAVIKRRIQIKLKV